MKVKEFIEQEIDIDVCDDYDESCYIAFCGPLKITPEGEREFAKALECDIEVHEESFLGAYDEVAIVHADNDAQVNILKKLFFSAAGYCSEKDYDKWFDEQ